MKWIGVLLFAIPFAAQAGDEPGILVKTAAMHRQTLTIDLTAYGAVISGIGGTQSISFPHAGQVTRLNVVSGQSVRKGQVLVEFTTDPAAVLAFEQAKSALEFSGHEFARMQRLFEQQLATKSQYDAAAKAKQDAQSAYAAQQVLGTGTLHDVLRASFSGVVAQVFVVQGARILAGAPGLQLIRSDAVRVQLGIEPEERARLKPGMPVQLVPVFDESQKMGGIVDEIQGMIDPQSQLVNLSVRIVRGDMENLLPGMRMRGTIQVHAENTWAVPRSAVLRDAQGDYIFQDNKGYARRVNVEAGLESGAWIAVGKNVDTQLPVVVLGNYELQDGMRLREDKQ